MIRAFHTHFHKKSSFAYYVFVAIILLVFSICEADVIFSDGIESGLGNWSATDVTQSAQESNSGNFSAFFDNQTGWMETTVDMSEYQGSNDVNLQFFWVDDQRWERTDSFTVDIYDGGWQRVYSYGDDQNDWTEINIDLDNISTLISSYKLRYTLATNDNREEAFVDDVLITGTKPTVPKLTGLSDATYISASQTTDGTEIVNIDFETGDTERDSVYISVQYRIGAGGWLPISTTYLSGDTGRIRADQPSVDRSISWDVGSHFPNTEASNYQVRLIADDESGGKYDSTITAMQNADLVIDTKDPESLASFSATDSTTNSVTVKWTICTDNNFDHYEVWLGTQLVQVEDRGPGASEWDNVDDSDLATITTDSTVITGLSPNTKYYFKVWAVDSYDHESTTDPDSIYTENSPAPSITGWDPNLMLNAGQIDSEYVRLGYEVSDEDDDSVTITVQYLLEGGSWNTLTNLMSGDTGKVATSPTKNDTIIIDMKTGLGSDKDTTCTFRLIGDNTIAQDTTYSDPINLDTRVPKNLGSFTHTDSTYNSVSLSWTSVSETNFNEYEVWYGTVLSDVQNRSGGASKWNSGNDPNLSDTLTSNTVVTGLALSTKYYFKIWASDIFGYESTTDEDSCTTQDGALPWSDGFEAGMGNWTVSNVTQSNRQSNSGTFSAFFDFQDAYIELPIDLSLYQGASDVNLLFYWRDDDRWENTDSFVVEIYNGTWQTAYSHVDDMDAWSEINIDLDNFGNLTSDFKIKFRMNTNDNREEVFVDDVLITGSTPTPPKLTGLEDATYISAIQTTDGTKIVNISFETGDNERDSVFIAAEYRIGTGGSWTIIPLSYLSGDTSRIRADQPTVDRNIAWDVGSHFPNTEAIDYQVRLITDDEGGGVFDSTVTPMENADLVIDTKDPLGLADFEATDSTSDSITLKWTSCTETNFSHYEIWLGVQLVQVEERGEGASEWDDDNDANLAIASIDSTVIEGLAPSTKYYFKIWAVDDQGNEVTTSHDSITTESTADPVVTGWDPVLNVNVTQYDSNNIRIGYEVSDEDDDTVNIKAQYKLYNGSWVDLNTNIIGDTGRISTSTSANDTIIWDIKSAFGVDKDTNCTIRIIGDNTLAWDTTYSEEFNVDRRYPQGLGSFTHTDSTYNSVTFSWSEVSETNHSEYEIWFGTVIADVQNRTGTADEWNSTDDANLSVKTTTSTIITALTSNTKYYFKIWAVDYYGYEITTSEDSCTTQSGALPWSDGFEAGIGNWTVSNVTQTNQQSNSGTFSAFFDFQDAYMELSMDLSLYQGASDVNLLFYWRDDDRWENTDSFVVEIYNGTWLTAYTHVNNMNAFIDINIDLDNLGDLTSDFKIKFRMNTDNNREEAFVDDVLITGSTPTPPKLTGLEDAAYISAFQTTDGTKTVNISFETGDNEQDSVYITAEYRIGSGGSWSAIPGAYLSGDTGRIDGNQSSVDRNIAWDIGSHLPNTEATDYQVRLTANDEGGGVYNTTTTPMEDADLVIDTKNPLGLANLAATDSTPSSVTLEWISCTETNFNHYEIWLGTQLVQVEDRGPGATEWDNSDDANLTNKATNSTIISGLTPVSLYYFKIWAVDDKGNEITTAADSITTESTPAPVVTGWDPALKVNASQYDSNNVRIGYEVDDEDDATVTVKAEYHLYNGSWLDLTTNIIGDTGEINTSPTADDTIIWDIKSAFGSDKDTTCLVRILAADATDEDTTLSDTFTIDTRPPLGLGTFNNTDSTYSSVGLAWNAVTETNFDEYEIWYGTVLADVQNRTGTADVWNSTDDEDMSDKLTTSTLVTGLSTSTKYYFKIWALDDYGYEEAGELDSSTTQDGVFPWSDGFEFGMGNWTVSDVIQSDVASNSGTYSAFIDNMTGWMEVELDLSLYQGASDVNLQFFWQDNGNWDPADSFVVDIYNGSWQQVYSHLNDQDDFLEVNIDLDAQSNLTSNYKIKFRTNSGNNEEAFVDDVLVSGTIPTAPKLTGLTDASYISASQTLDGTKIVNIDYETGDNEQDSVYITAEYRVGTGGSWSAIPAAYLSGDTGRIRADQSTTDRGIAWNVGSHLPNTEATNYQIRLTADDEGGGVYNTTTTPMENADLVVDTKDPLGLANLSATDSTPSNVTLEWTSCTETNFNHYEVWLGTQLIQVQNRDAGATEWDNSDDGNLTTVSTNTTTVIGLAPVTKYYFKIWAIDDQGNETTTSADSITTESTPAPVVSGWDPSLKVNSSQYDSNNVRIGYEVDDTDDDTVTVKAQYLLYNGSWTDLITNIVGDTGEIATSATANDTIIWDIKTAFGSDKDTTCLVRIIAEDVSNEDTTLSDTFTIDTRPPQGIGTFNNTDSTYSSVGLAWNAVTETNFNEYEIWFGTVLADVQSRSGTADEWNSTDDVNLSNKATISTVVTGLNANTKYYFKIWALDDYGYEEAGGEDSSTTQDGVLPWFDGFEFGMGNWTTSSVSQTNTESHEGTFSAYFQNQSGNMEVTHDLSLYQGASDVQLKFFWRNSNNFEATDSFVVEIDNGSLNQVYSEVDDQGSFIGVTIDLDDLGALTSNYKIKYRISTNNGNEEAYVDSVSIIGTIPEAPTLTGLSGATYISAAQDTTGTKIVTINFETGDNEQDSVYITAEYRVGTGSWAAIPTSYLSGDTGRLVANLPDVDRSIDWDVGSHLPNTEASNYQVRLIVDDEGGGVYATTTTPMQDANLSIDTKDPIGLADFVAADSTPSSIFLEWTPCTELNFKHYEVWFGTNLSEVESRGGGASKWDNDDDANLAVVSADSTVINGLNAATKYYLKIWALDDFSNEVTTTADSISTDSTASPVVTGWDPELKVYAAQYDSEYVRIGYEVEDANDDTVTVKAQYKIFGTIWQNLTTNITGDTGEIATSPTANDTIIWDIKTAFGSDVDTTCFVRILAADDTDEDTTLTENFTIDTRIPQGLGSFACADSTYNSVGITWTAATETNFNEYKVWYGTVLADVLNRTGTASEWNSGNDENLSNVATSGTTVSGLSTTTKYYFKIWAVDDYGFESTTSQDSCTTQDGTLPWSDGFESGMGNWTTSNVIQSNMYSATGTFSARFQNQTGYMELEIDLALYQGTTDANLKFDYRNDGGWDIPDSFVVDVYNGSWSRAYSTTYNQDNFTEINVDLDDVGNLTSNYKIKFRINTDNNAEEGFVDDVLITSSTPTAPKLTGLTDATYLSASQSTDGSKIVTVNFETGDTEQDSVYITGEYKKGSGSWTSFTVSYLSGDTGRMIANAPSTDRAITWNVGSELPDEEATNYQVRLTADDEGGGVYNTKTTAMQTNNLIIDTKAPSGLGGFQATNLQATQITLSWSNAFDDNFNHYEIWYGLNQSNVQNRTASEWDNTDDANLLNSGTNSTTITGLTGDNFYYCKIWAIDDYGNEATITDIKVYTSPIVIQWSRDSLGEIKGGAIAEGVIYIGTDENTKELKCINVANGATKWNADLSSYGACNMPTYIYTGGYYEILASAGNYVVGIRDLGASFEEIFVTSAFGATPGNPYTSPDDSTFFVVYGDTLTRKRMNNGNTVSGWPIRIANLNKDADIVVFNDEIYAASSDGKIFQIEPDGTVLDTFSGIGANCALPLLVYRNTIYVTPNSSKLYAVKTADMSEKWNTNLQGTNSGAAFTNGDDTIYVAAGNYVQKVFDNTTEGNVIRNYNASDVVQSGPIPFNGVVYFGRDNGRYYAIEDNGASFLDVTNWPFKGATGDASTGPWIDETSSPNRVIFGTTGGDLHSFEVE